MTLSNKTQELHNLTKEYERQNAIRVAYSLGFEGRLRVAFVKPPGATMEEKKAHKVHIFIDDKLKVIDTLPAFTKKVG